MGGCRHICIATNSHGLPVSKADPSTSGPSITTKVLETRVGSELTGWPAGAARTEKAKTEQPNEERTKMTQDKKQRQSKAEARRMGPVLAGPIGLLLLTE